MKDEDMQPTNEKQTFKVAIGSSNDLPDLKTSATEIDPGFSYTFHITPSSVISSASIFPLSSETRNCRFRHETDGLNLFNVSYAAHSAVCLYEI